MTRRRYIQIDGKLIEIPLHYISSEKQTSFQVMPDIKPYQSMIDGRMITSRSTHREHLRQHGCEEIGNDSSLTRAPKPLESPPGLKETIIEAARKYKFL